MHIGIDASRANNSIKTGVEWYSYHLIQLFKEIDHDDQFSLYTQDPLGGGLEIVPSNFNECRLRWLPKYLWTQIRLSWEMLRRPPDVLFIPAHAIPLIAPHNTVVTIHDIGFDRFPELYKPIQIWYHRFATRRAVKNARAIITVSEFSKQELCAVYGVDPRKIFVTPLGFDQKMYSATNVPSRIQGRYGIRNPYIMYVGRLEEKKNIRRLLQAFELVHSLVSDLELVLIGTPGYGYADLQSELHNPAIHQLGWLPASEIAELYRGAQALVFATLYEGFGLPVVEAQASGCPVICSSTTALPEVAGRGAYFVDPLSVREIAKAISHVIHDQSLRARLIADGYENARRFSWERCAKETLAVLKMR